MPLVRLVLLIAILILCLKEIVYVYSNFGFWIGSINLIVVVVSFELVSRKVVKRLKANKRNRELGVSSDNVVKEVGDSLNE